MKVYASPIPARIDFDAAAEAAHSEALKAWLKEHGYTGKHTGETVRFPVADGQAAYMLGEGKKSILIHLPYGDAYHYPDVKFLPKAEIMRRIEADKRLAKFFAEKRAS